MKTNIPIERMCYITSGILHPATLLILSITLISNYINTNILIAIRDTSVFIIGIIPGWFYHFISLHRKKTLNYYEVKNYHKTILLWLIIGIGIIIIIYSVIGVQKTQIRLIIITLLSILGSLGINRLWKISFHATISMICAALFINISPVTAITMGSFSIIAGLSRIPLGLHTKTQVIAGWIYGFCITSILMQII